MSMLKSRRREVNTGVCVWRWEGANIWKDPHLLVHSGWAGEGRAHLLLCAYVYLNAEVLFQQECIPSTFNNLFLNLRKKSNLRLWENDRQSEFSSGPGGQRNPGQHGQAGPSWGALALWGPGCPGLGRLAGVELWFLLERASCGMPRVDNSGRLLLWGWRVY